MEMIMPVEMAHQRKIREAKKETDNSFLFGVPKADIKQAELKEISYDDAKSIILDYEWLGTMGTTQYHYGIFYEGTLSGVVCFGYFQAMLNENKTKTGGGYSYYVGDKYWDKGIQLTRGACAWWCHEHSGSKLIAYGLREIAKRGFKFVVAFSDGEAGEIGTLYQATNWNYIGSSGRTHWDVYHKSGGLYLNDRDFHKRNGFSGKKELDSWAIGKPYLIKPRYAKGRYIKLIGTKRENKEMMAVLKDKVKPYPKRTD
jgi:hypothetical protein